MKNQILFLTCFFLCCFFWLLVTSCAGSAALDSDGLSPAEFFQKAYEAADNKNYKLAIRYYQLFQEKFPDDVERNLWAEYEIAFSYYKMGEKEKAVEAIDQLLDRYEQEGAEVYPPGPKALAEKVKLKLKS